MDLYHWLAVVLQLLTLCSIVFSAVKIINKNEAEWLRKEIKFEQIEEDLRGLKSSTTQLASLEVSLNSLKDEMKRIRDRLDRFLDTQSDSRKE